MPGSTQLVVEGQRRSHTHTDNYGTVLILNIDMYIHVLTMLSIEMYIHVS